MRLSYAELGDQCDDFLSASGGHPVTPGRAQPTDTDMRRDPQRAASYPLVRLGVA